jgi:type IV pilus assembly protein PilW
MKPSTHQLVNTPVPRKIKGDFSFQRGLSLIELMISITIGLIILVALSGMFVNQSRARVELDKSNRMIDNGRYALELLSDSLNLAGYYGEFVPTTGVPTVPATLPDPCSTLAADMAAALQLAVQGYDAANPTSNISSLPPLCVGLGLTYSPGSALTLKPGSDILVIRRVSTATPIVQSVALAGTHYLQASLCQYDALLYKVDTVPANFTLRTKTCTPSSTTPYAVLRQFVVQVYFVTANDKVTAGVGDGIPTLKRMELDPTTHVFVTTPLVEGIDFMQIEYGLDTNNDGIADSYVSAPAVTDWPNVVAVKMHILARNTESTKGYTDNKTYSLGPAGTVTPGNSYKRHAYTQYIRLVNPAGRREIP